MTLSPGWTRRAAAPLRMTSPGPPLHRVRLEARAVVDVEDVHLLVLEDVGELHQHRIEGDRADVVEIGRR